MQSLTAPLFVHGHSPERSQSRTRSLLAARRKRRVFIVYLPHWEVCVANDGMAPLLSCNIAIEKRLSCPHTIQTYSRHKGICLATKVQGRMCRHPRILKYSTSATAQLGSGRRLCYTEPHLHTFSLRRLYMRFGLVSCCREGRPLDPNQ